MELENYQAQSSKHGYSALRIAQEQSFDLVICSRNFTDTNCWNILQELRKKESTVKTPFIFLSSKPLGDLHQKIENEEKTFIIIKPFHINEILHFVKKCLSS